MHEVFRQMLVKKRTAYQLRADDIRKKENLIAWARLITFFAGVVLLYMGIIGERWFLIGGIILLSFFLLLIRRHASLREQREKEQGESMVMERYLWRLDGTWTKIQDTGEEFLTKEDTLSRDLDLLGPASLYQLINVGHTAEGRRKLADTLSLKNNFLKERSQRFQAVKELSENPELLLNFETASEQISLRKSRFLSEREEGESRKDRFSAAGIFCMILIPLANILAFLLILLNRASWGTLAVTFFVGLILTGILSSGLSGCTAVLNQYGSSAEDYEKLLKILSGGEMKASLLRDMKEAALGDSGMLKAIGRMKRLSALDKFGMNPILQILLDGFLGWDLMIAFAAHRWNQKYGQVFSSADQLFGDFEELESLAVLLLVRNCTEPVILEPSVPVSIQGTGIRHPLIQEDHVVANPADVQNRLTILTGSNMSGKTTYLRTLAMNMVLAYTGTGVTADSFQIPVMKIFTSMRVHDDVANGISTFYAEILRIRKMADYTEQEKKDSTLPPAVCFIDEIFKGTNSADRIVGASEALKRLATGSNLVLVSTHDFELCDLKEEDGTPAANAHFQEHYEGDRLAFDYRLRKGRCTTTNAMAILKMAGLIRENPS